MSLRVCTARVSYRGPDRLDVTRKSGGPAGTPFAPSWALLGPFLKKRSATGLTDADWAAYVAGYQEEMRASYAHRRSEWDALLARGQVTLCCYCTDSDRCHRTILASILVVLGAVYEGERP